jgi:hypothetical protein
MLLTALHGNASQQVKNQDQCNRLPLEVEVEVAKLEVAKLEVAKLEVEVEVAKLELSLGRLAQQQLER